MNSKKEAVKQRGFWYRYLFAQPAVWIVLTFSNYVLGMKYGYIALAHAGFVFFSVISAYLYRTEMKKRFSCILRLGFLLPIAYLYGRIAAVHFYNSEFGIYPEYLNFSVSIWAFFIVLTSVPALLMLVVGLTLLFESFRRPAWLGLEQGIHSISALISFFCFVWLGQQIEKWHLYPLLADTYTASDCNVRHEHSGGLYIRKDQNTCYKVEIGKGAFITLVPFHSPKP